MGEKVDVEQEAGWDERQQSAAAAAARSTIERDDDQERRPRLAALVISRKMAYVLSARERAGKVQRDAAPRVGSVRRNRASWRSWFWEASAEWCSFRQMGHSWCRAGFCSSH